MSRVYARHMARFLPGKPTIVVRNMPGGDATIGANYVYASKPDGLTALVSGSGSLIAYITRMSAAKYDLQKTEYVFGYTGGGFIFAKSGIVSKPEDLPKAKGIVFGHSSGAGGWLFYLATKLMDIKPDKVIVAYGSGGDARRAFFSGEINMSFGDAAVYWGTIEPYVKRGEVQSLFQTGIIGTTGDMVRDPTLPADLPTFKEVYEKVLGKAPSGVLWDAFKGLTAAGRTYGEVLLLPPGVPQEITRAYWAAADAMVKDAEFHKEADPLVTANANWMVGESNAKQFRANMTMDPRALEALKATLQEINVVFN